LQFTLHLIPELEAQRYERALAAGKSVDDLVLVTGNTRHFDRIQALGYPRRLDDWRLM